MEKYIAHEQIGYYCKDTEVWVNKRLSRMPYAQAGVISDGRGVSLISYSTLVCTISPEGWLTCTGTYSATTRKHIGAFMHEYGNGADYYTAKRCYEAGEAYNVFTGEILTLEEYARRAA